MDKRALRQKYRELRNGLSEVEIAEKSLAVANNVLRLPVWGMEYFHVFLPIDGKNEVETSPLLSLLAGRDKKIVVSSADFESRSMTHYLLDDDVRIKPNAHGIPEPQNGEIVPTLKIDVVFVPLLAFDLLGQRVGYGMGFYDRFLDLCRKDVIKVGLSLFGAEPVIDDVNPDDVALNYCVTPGQIYRF